MGEGAWLRMVNALESLFPGLTGKKYQITSPSDDVYNCIAWAASSSDQWWWPVDLPGHFWPANVPKVETLDAFRQLFESLGYSVCGDCGFEAGFEKVAIFSDASVSTWQDLTDALADLGIFAP